MTLNEFRAWLEGFSEAFDGGAPSPEQWAKITKKLAEVQGPIDYGLLQGSPLPGTQPDYHPLTGRNNPYYGGEMLCAGDDPVASAVVAKTGDLKIDAREIEGPENIGAACVDRAFLPSDFTAFMPTDLEMDEVRRIAEANDRAAAALFA